MTILRTVQTRLESLAPTPVGPSETLAWEPQPDAAPGPPPALAEHPRYRPIRLLGSGGMGTVWLAEHTVMGRLVALKVIRPEYLTRPGAVERFRREVHAAARLHHPNIVASHDAEEAGATHFLVMEYVEGVSLAEHLARKGPLPIAEVCRLAHDARAWGCSTPRLTAWSTATSSRTEVTPRFAQLEYLNGCCWSGVFGRGSRVGWRRTDPAGHPRSTRPHAVAGSTPLRADGPSASACSSPAR